MMMILSKQKKTLASISRIEELSTVQKLGVEGSRDCWTTMGFPSCSKYEMTTTSIILPVKWSSSALPGRVLILYSLVI